MSIAENNLRVSMPSCEKSIPSRTFLILTVAFVTALMVSNLIAGKLISVGGLVLPAAVVLFPLTYIFGDVFTEVYGFRSSKLVIWLGFAANLFAVGVYCLTIALPHPEFWQGQEAYKQEIVMKLDPKKQEIIDLWGMRYAAFLRISVIGK